MRHKIAGNKLNRFSSFRKATIRDLAKAVLIQQRICTTEAKAKESRKMVDKLVTLGKKRTLADKRRAFAILCNHKLVSELFTKIAPRFKDRIGGYSRIIRLGTRRGDNAKMVFLELTEKEKIIVSKPGKVKDVKKRVTEPVLSGKKETEVAVTADEKEVKKRRSEKGDDINAQARKEIISKGGKGNTKKKDFLGGLRKVFNKKSQGK